MTTLVLQVAGAAVGGIFGPVGAMVGRAAGGLAGSMIDRALFAGKSTAPAPTPEARLRDIEVTSATEGTPIPRAYGRVRIAGQIIWATRMEAVVTTTTETQTARGGGKGNAFKPPSQTHTTTTTTTSYYANVALGLCEGPIAAVRRVWADGKPLDLAGVTMRVYTGTQDQPADPLIVAKEGAERTPAHRGLAYVVFERLAVGAYGNRVPQLSFEVIRPVGRLENMIRAVTVIPGATEFGYATTPVVRTLGLGVSAPENHHTTIADTDWEASIDELQAVCPNLERVNLIAAWFGDDRRCGSCTVAPRVDNAIKQTAGATWAAGGLSRGAATVVSQIDGRPAYGGSPSDASLVAAIRDLKARGLGVTLTPFMMMDIPAGNALTDPDSGEAGQPAYPWRGTITCTPAPGRPGTVDGTSGAAAQVAAFFGTVAPGHFALSGDSVIYSGPAEWSYRRFILHMAWLAKAAGGVETFVIGSEMIGLTRVRSGSGIYPAVTALIALAADVKAVLPNAKVTYAADWTEYGAHVLSGGAEVRFPLDPLWASGSIDAVGVDFYAPMADWRAGEDHMDAASADGPCDRAYLAANLSGGEAFDWYYPNGMARADQDRLEITDGLGKPWIFRQKDIPSWWGNTHHERVGGAELETPTAWTPGMKPVWLMEAGCPAVDKGANAPHVFPDPKSAAGGLPPFSRGDRDDLIQRRALEAVLTHAAAIEAIDESRVHLWTWDARPYPVFPLALGVWSDGSAWRTGHWLNGRLGSAPMDDLVATILADAGVTDADTDALEGVADGYAVERPASARDALDPLAGLFAFDALEREGELIFRPRGRGLDRVIALDALAEDEGEAMPARIRAQETELPATVTLAFADVEADFRPALTSSRRGGTSARGEEARDTALTLDRGEAARRADILLQDRWIGRETVKFALPPGELAVEPGDRLVISGIAGARRFEVASVEDGPLRRVEARAIEPAVFDAPRPAVTEVSAAVPPPLGPVELVVLDLAAPEEGEPVLSRVAATASPWPGAIVLWQDRGGTFTPSVTLDRAARIGATLDALSPGPLWRWDRGASFRVTLANGELLPATEVQALGGANLAAVVHPEGGCEIVAFTGAELVGVKTWRLTGLLRGLGGSEALAGVEKPAGSRFILLDGAVQPLASGLESLGVPTGWRATPAGLDHGSPFAVPFTATATDAALKPLAPVHARATRGGEGVSVAWTRRSRIGGDTWEAVDVPLGEGREAYRIEVLDGGVVVRAAETAIPQWLYATADENADFGAPRAALTLRIAQWSDAVGWGETLTRTIHV